MPTDNFVNGRLAVPPVRTTGDPRLMPPSMNWMVPLGLFPGTVEVNVMLWPAVAGLSDEAIVGVPALRVTSSLRTVEVLVELELSPL